MTYQTVSRVSSSGFMEFRLGWMALLCAFLGVMAGVVSTYLYTIGVFFIPLEKQFGWTRLDLSLANFLAAATVAGISPLVGRLADKLGVRTVIVMSLFRACAERGANRPVPNLASRSRFAPPLRAYEIFRTILTSAVPER